MASGSPSTAWHGARVNHEVWTASRFRKLSAVLATVVTERDIVPESVRVTRVRGSASGHMGTVGVYVCVYHVRV